MTYEEIAGILSKGSVLPLEMLSNKLAAAFVSLLMRGSNAFAFARSNPRILCFFKRQAVTELAHRQKFSMVGTINSINSIWPIYSAIEAFFRGNLRKLFLRYACFIIKLAAMPLPVS